MSAWIPFHLWQIWDMFFSELNQAGRSGSRCGLHMAEARKHFPQVDGPGICCSIRCNRQWCQQSEDALSYGVNNFGSYEDARIRDGRSPVCLKKIEEGEHE